MCECGCTSNDERYTFPAPGQYVYVLTLTKGCVDCDAGAGISIERMPKKHFQSYVKEFVDGELRFEDWCDSEGVAITTGHRKYEFVKALLPQLVGLKWREFAEGGVLDECSAEVILEDLFDDVQFKPRIVEAVKR